MNGLPSYDVLAIRYGEQKERPEGSTFMGGDPAKMIPGLDFFTYVITGAGRTWVVDTGFKSDISGEGGRMHLHDPAAVLGRLGVEAKTATDVLLTHAHFDHVGNLADYP
ncbi:MAG: MBL fold metallo-hydrolase, partial [Alphaproteobacteria bacterium]|nr:MBL fold metallo-hydrolase [Alphaproteobacteria bacterium]